MEFIGRERELKKLRTAMETSGLETVLVYGRRRIGKSELVKEALRHTGRKAVYYECRQVAESSNAAGLNEVVSDVFDLPKLGYRSIEEVLEYLFQLSQQEPVVFVLDEYPYLRDNIQGMDSILQALIDKYRETANLTLILLGSFVEIMKSMLEHSNPLYGRIDLSIHLHAMDYFDSARFYPGFSNEDKVRIYSVFGGIPYYNRLVDDRKSVRENIISLISGSGARLENEVSMFLSQEIRKIVNANEVFSVLAKGTSKFGDILSKSSVSSSPALADILNKLIEMEIVIKMEPINAHGRRNRASYAIDDHLSLFYYRYIYRYLSQREIMDEEVFFEKYIEKDFEEDFVPHQFERICREYLIRQNRKGLIEPVLEKIGKYWYNDPISRKNGEFDVVSKDENGYIFYEVKFRSQPVTVAMMEKEIQQVKEAGLPCWQYGFFSRSGFEDRSVPGTLCVDLNEIYDEHLNG